MVRIVLGAIVGFFAWSIVWVGSEKIFSAIWPAWYGAHQHAFEAAIATGGQFTPDTTILVMNIVRGAIVSAMAGFLAALIAGENKRSPLILGVLLLAFDLLIVVLSWRHVPLWYGVIFTVLLIPMTILGGKLKTTA
ncbi:MAG TPA: hypothetical protein VLB68_24865 [Pyrinomonadaceae bacterium]|jgi:hypothetical protein|nr:hypothetical protein [Pyrinomonadaceae bacterium]